MDGIDIAVLDTDGETVDAFGPVAQRAYSAEERALLTHAMSDARPLTDRTERSGALAEAEAMVTAAHVDATHDFMNANGLKPSDIQAIGFHGQTVLHHPETQLTIQIGDGVALAQKTGLKTIWDLRAADVASGGQGAPLVPVYHRALVRRAQLETPVAVVNLGGVGNVSYIDGDTFTAFDTGPANALVDDWMLRHRGVAMDVEGAVAASGHIHENRIEIALADPFFDVSPPKSIDRHDFDRLGAALSEGLSIKDGAATLTAYSAACLARAVDHFPAPPRTWIMTGGGVCNPTLMAMLTSRLPGEVCAASDLGWQTEYIEAQAFAYLAARSLRGLPLTFPGTTGAPEPMPGGVISEP